jgi:hypothetical protein
VADRRSELFAGERVASGAGFAALAMFQRAAPTKPLVLFLPGGGHLARIAYGHPGAVPEDFLLTHLTRAGFSTLALSYPSAHPSMNNPVPEMTITQWAASSAAIAAECIATEQLPLRVIALGWSLAGRLARDLAVAFRSHGIALEIFIGLSAAPPVPGFGGLSPADLQLAPTGLLDGSSERSSIFRSRGPQLAVIDGINGRVVLPRDIYAELYVTDSPINFRGEAERYGDHGLVTDIGAAIADQGTFDFKSYPLCGTVSAASPSDARHALTNASAWGMLNAQTLYFQTIQPSLVRGEGTLASVRELDPRKWEGLLRLMDGLAARLSRRVEGSHFFFVGQAGASATAAHVEQLVDEAASVRSELSALLA